MLGGAELVEASSDGEPGDKSRFVRGVERALLAGEAEVGVHSAKDLPGEMPEGLEIAAVPPREDPADVWIGAGSSLDDVPEGARVGTASLRRRAQLLAARPDLRVEELHGNVDTRLRKLAEGDLDAIVLAAAGLRRLGRERGDRLRDPGRADGPGAPARARWRSRSAPATRTTIGGRRRDPATRDALRELTAERAAVAPCSRRPARPRSASTPGSRASASRSKPSSACPTAASGCATGSRARPPSPPPPASLLAERLLAPAPATSSTAPRPRHDDGATPSDHRADTWPMRPATGNHAMSARAGVVYLVGAGPGDPGLMTARSLELIASADAVFYDRLIPPGALAGAREDAELVYVGKQPGVPSVPQEEIGERLIEAARAGRSVVRLKGGDPFVFGRGGEEGEALRAAGVEFEVVPGVTAGVAATAYAGIPVTHRDDASAVAFVTGHEDPAKDETALDWEALAAFPGTLVFYMGVKRLAENAAALIAAGRDPEQPAAAIERGHDGRASARSRRRWGRSPTAVEREEVGAPALIVVGPVAARRDRARLARAAPAARPPRRRHPRPRPGQRPRRDPARPRRRGGRAAGDPDRAADRRARRCAGRRPRSASTRCSA